MKEATPPTAIEAANSQVQSAGLLNIGKKPAITLQVKESAENMANVEGKGRCAALYRAASSDRRERL